MLHNHAEENQGWWVLVLAGILAIALGAALIVLPADVLSVRILDMIFGMAGPFSFSMSALAAVLALVAVVAIDGLVSLIAPGMKGKVASRVRGAAGIVVAAAVIFWPDRTVFAAVQLIGIWAMMAGVFELFFARYADDGKDRALSIIAAIALMAIGVSVVKWSLIGTLLISAVIGVAAAVRGVSLIALGIKRGAHHESGSEKTVGRATA